MANYENVKELGGKYPVDGPTAAQVVCQCRRRQWANCMMDKTQLEGKWEKQSDRERGKRERGGPAGSTIGHQRFLATAAAAALFEVSPSAAAAKGVKERERSLIHLLHSFPLFLSGDSKRERNEEESFVGRRQECGGEGEG